MEWGMTQSTMKSENIQICFGYATRCGRATIVDEQS